MDQGSLVREQIDAGAEFLDRIHASIPVKVAFWLKGTEEGRWALYVASDKIGSSPSIADYREMARVEREMDDPNLSQSRVRLIGAGEPLARAALELQRPPPRRPLTWYKGSPFGNISVEGAYLYPPEDRDDPWRGTSIMVFEEPAGEAYRVEFWPRELQVALPPGGWPRKVTRPAVVRVEGSRVTEYSPPEKAVPPLTQGDYERKALAAVEQLAGKLVRSE